jgi:hypothetical protein
MCFLFVYGRNERQNAHSSGLLNGTSRKKYSCRPPEDVRLALNFFHPNVERCFEKHVHSVHGISLSRPRLPGSRAFGSNASTKGKIAGMMEGDRVGLPNPVRDTPGGLRGFHGCERNWKVFRAPAPKGLLSAPVLIKSQKGCLPC